MKSLGRDQIELLWNLIEHKQWYGEADSGYGSGWSYGTRRQTKHKLNTLVKRGLVDTHERHADGRITTVYTPSAVGVRTLRSIVNAPKPKSAEEP